MKATLRSIVVIISVFGLMLYIGYSAYKYPELLKENFNTVLSIALAIANTAVLKWLFSEDKKD